MDAKAEPAGCPAPRAREFPTTEWSLVLQAGSPQNALARSSLETLCRQYWFPLYAFLRRQGHAHSDAEDLTQGFFVHVLGSAAIAHAAPERGRFRTFLLSSLRHYAVSVWRQSHALKRGGEAPTIPLDLTNAQTCFANEPADLGSTPEEAFDRAWALGLIEQAVDELRKHYVASGRADLFSTLLPYVVGEAAGEPHASAARQLGLNEHAFTVAVSRLRGRLRERLRAQVANTVADPTETDDELRILLKALRVRTNAV